MGATKISLLLCFLAALSSLDHVMTTRLTGPVNYSLKNRNLVLFLTRFGVKSGRDVYLFGSANRIINNRWIGIHSRMTLAFIPQAAWNGFYRKANVPRSAAACLEVMNSTMLRQSIIVGESTCESGFEDYIRKLPCDSPDENYIACNQPDTVDVVPHSSFTYRKQNVPNTEFYYIFIIACSRNVTETCNWAGSDEVYFNYDITIVNSDPTSSNKNDFDYQFSYEFHGVLILEMIFTLLYLILVAIQFILHSRLVAGKGYSPHLLIQLFTSSLVLDLLHVACEMIHFSVFAANGMGVVAMKYFGEVFNQLSDWLLILVLILVAKGWQVTTCTIRWKKLTSVVWGVYIFVSGIYFVWMVVKEQVYPLNTQVEHSFQSWAGGVYLLYRVLVLIYSLYGMRQMYLIENRPTKLKLYVVLSVIYIVWFSYLPVAVILAFAANPVLRYIALRTIILLFDLFINVFMLALFCPRWSDKFFQFESHINVLSKISGTYKSLRGTYGSASQVI